MSRVAKNPVVLPDSVKLTVNGAQLLVEGPKGRLEWTIPVYVKIVQSDAGVTFSPASDEAPKDSQAPDAWALSGTARALLSNMIIGVSLGFEKKLILKGVGYRAQMQGTVLDLTLGFSHPVKFDVPEGVTIQTPSNTEIIVSGIDKQLVGQVAANIREYRKPDSYKGKGIRYADEVVILKEVKKK